MSSSSDDLVPLVNRVKALASSQQPNLASDDDDDVPLWLRNYTSPQKEAQKNKRHKAAIMLTDSDSDAAPAAAPPSKALAPQAGRSGCVHLKSASPAHTCLPCVDLLQHWCVPSSNNTVKSPQPTAASPTIKHAPAGVHGTPHTASALLPPPTANASQLPTPSNELVIHLPEKLPRTKLLVELEPDEHGATDLAGDAGAVGRLLVSGNPGQEDIKLDLKGSAVVAVVVVVGFWWYVSGMVHTRRCC